MYQQANLTLGSRSTIDPTATISPDVAVVMGDCSMIGPGVNVSGRGTFRVGDYVKVHRGTWVNCGNVSVGHNCWVGERSVLDGTGGLTLRNNVGIGAGCQLWSHVAFGDPFAGCKFRSSRAIELGNDAWLMGAVLLQACNVAERVVVLGGSNVVRDITAPNTLWSGNPAADATDPHDGPPWDDVPVEQLLRRFERLLRAYEADTHRKWSDAFVGVAGLPTDRDRVYFNVTDRTYTKTGTLAEQQFMLWLHAANKAKFTPVP